MDALWVMWLGSAAVGALIAALPRPGASGWPFDALLLFLLGSLVCDGLAALGMAEGWRLNPYAMSGGFALAATLRSLLQRTRSAALR